MFNIPITLYTLGQKVRKILLCFITISKNLSPKAVLKGNMHIIDWLAAKNNTKH